MRNLILFFITICLCNLMFATILANWDIQCAICGEESDHDIFMSTHTSGSPDLDLRPSEPARYLNDVFIQFCPNCGYCASDISQKECEGIEALLESEHYVSQLNNSEFPSHANYYLCAALIMDYCKKYNYGGLLAHGAAWECDDAGNNKGASICRIRAVEYLEKAKENKQMFAEHKGVEELILTDLLRRAGKFKHASSVCQSGLTRYPARVIRIALEFEKSLIKSKNTDVYTIEDALENIKIDTLEIICFIVFVVVIQLAVLSRYIFLKRIHGKWRIVLQVLLIVFACAIVVYIGIILSVFNKHIWIIFIIVNLLFAIIGTIAFVIRDIREKKRSHMGSGLI